MNKDEVNQYIIDKYNPTPIKGVTFQLTGKTREELPILFKELGYGLGTELGVLGGEFTESFCKQDLNMFGIDAWLKYGEYKDFSRQSTLNDYESQARERLKDYQCTLLKGFSSDVVSQFLDNSLDFVYIDCNHALEFVIEDIAKWSKKVKSGGIISGHDYTRKHSNTVKIHVKDAINAWVYSYGISPLFLTDEGSKSSWFFVK